MILILNAGSLDAHTIADIVDNEMDACVIPILNATSEDFENIKGVIISNGSLSIVNNDITDFANIVEMALKTNVPIIGIGLGHQLLGMHFGAQASFMKHDVGLQTVECFEESDIFNRLPTEVEMTKNHLETISIPPGFKLIAASDACVNEAMQHEEKPIFGVQFLPELSGNHGAVMIENFVFLCLRGENE